MIVYSSLVGVALALSACTATTTTPPSLDEAAVEELAQNVIVAYPGIEDADSEALQDFCLEFSAAQQFCVDQGAQASANHGEVDISTVTFSIKEASPSSYLVTFSGDFLSGETFKSETLCNVLDNRVVFSNAAFWFERRYSESTVSPGPTT